LINKIMKSKIETEQVTYSKTGPTGPGIKTLAALAPPTEQRKMGPQTPELKGFLQTAVPSLDSYNLEKNTHFPFTKCNRYHNSAFGLHVLTQIWTELLQGSGFGQFSNQKKLTPNSTNPMKSDFLLSYFRLTVFACMALVMCVSPNLYAQSDTGTVSGTVYNEVTGSALQGAVVRVIGTNAVDRTDLEGRFSLSGVPAGSQQLNVRYVGLEPSTQTVNVSVGQSQFVEVGLSSAVYDLENFIVVPQVVGQERAINQQKTAAGIINIVSEEQFGAMLDGNIGQALQRLPGLSVDESQDGSQGAINIRGIAGEYNSVQIDGNTIPSSGGNRDFNPRNMAADGVTTIEVIKAPTPDRDGDAIGGIVNLVSRNAFQREGPTTGVLRPAFLSRISSASDKARII
jgi:hypothetical protein